MNEHCYELIELDLFVFVIANNLAFFAPCSSNYCPKISLKSLLGLRYLLVCHFGILFFFTKSEALQSTYTLNWIEGWSR